MKIRHYTTDSACSCPHWRYRPHRRPCRHVEGIRSALALLQAQDTHNGQRNPHVATWVPLRPLGKFVATSC